MILTSFSDLIRVSAFGKTSIRLTPFFTLTVRNALKKIKGTHIKNNVNNTWYAKKCSCQHHLIFMVSQNTIKM